MKTFWTKYKALSLVGKIGGVMALLLTIPVCIIFIPIILLGFILFSVHSFFEEME